MKIFLSITNIYNTNLLGIFSQELQTIFVYLMFKKL